MMLVNAAVNDPYVYEVRGMVQRAILCPRCRQLIGSSESVCSWCGTSRSAPWWRLVNLSRGAVQADWIVKIIISVNILFFAISLMLSIRLDGSVGFLSPGRTSLFLLGASGTIPIDRYGRFWSLVSANYLHGGIFHILFNLMALRQLVPWVANEYGISRMFIIYTLGGISGYMVSYFAGVPFTIGASAALCSLIGSLLYYGKNRGGAYGSSVYREVSGWVVSLFVFGLISPGINNWAHGGGIVGGIVFGILVGYNERKSEGFLHHLLALFCAVITIGVLGWAVSGALG
jgi:rhomboid protease GluP